MRIASWIFAVASTALVLFCFIAAGMSIRDDGLGSDAAAWVQAAGAIAAITGAVWLSRIENVWQRRQRRREREEAAWGVRFALVHARNEAYTIAHELADDAKALGSEGGRHWRTRCRNVQYLLRHYASRSDPLHPAVVQIANNALLLAEEMEADVAKAGAFLSREERPPLKIAEAISWYEIQFQTLLKELDNRARSISLALDLAEDMLPLRDTWSELRRD